MKHQEFSSPAKRFFHFAVVSASAAMMVVTGCGTPGAPMPPSLRLPSPVENLTARREGDRVELTWAMPKRTTDKLPLKGPITVEVCRKEVGEARCQAIDAKLAFAPAAHAEFAETLPASLASGSPRALSYLVQLENNKGRTAGPSNAAIVLAGAAPGEFAGLAAEVRKHSLLLHWDAPDRGDSANIVVRLQRKLVQPAAERKPQTAPSKDLFSQGAESAEQTLLVESEAGVRAPLTRTLDRSIRVGSSYEYRAQWVARIDSEGKTLELAGPLSAPVHVDVRDVFPPDVPAGLAAVANVGDAAANPPVAASVDLSWQPSTDPDVAGYVVYREGSSGWERISPQEPVVGPGFHDANVQPGRTYRYVVSAVDRGGRESAHSELAEETVPAP